MADQKITRTVTRTVKTSIEVSEDELHRLVRAAVKAPDDAEVRVTEYDGCEVSWQVTEYNEEDVSDGGH